MLLRRIHELIAQAEIESGGIELVIHVGELLALQLEREHGHVPRHLGIHRINPYAWVGAEPDEILMETRPFSLGHQGGEDTKEILRVTIPHGMSDPQWEIYVRLRLDHTPVDLAYQIATDLED